MKSFAEMREQLKALYGLKSDSQDENSRVAIRDMLLAWESEFYESNQTWPEGQTKALNLLASFDRLKARYPSIGEEESDSFDSEIARALEESEKMSQASSRSRESTPSDERQIGEFNGITEVFSYHDKSSPLSQGVNALVAEYPGARTIKGDGDCYYRSVIYSVVEQAVTAPDDDRFGYFEQLALKIDELRGTYSPNNLSPYHLTYDADEVLSKVADLFRDARDGQCWRTISELEADMRSPDSETDLLLTRAARLLTANQVLSAPNAREFIAEGDIENILTDGESIEGAAAEGFYLFDALGIDGHLVRIETQGHDRLAKGESETYRFEMSRVGFESLEPPLEVNILLKPGHYDLLYTHEQAHQLHAAKNQEFKTRANTQSNEANDISLIEAHIVQLEEVIEHQPAGISEAVDALKATIGAHEVDSQKALFAHAITRLLEWGADTLSQNYHADSKVILNNNKVIEALSDAAAQLEAGSQHNRP